MSKNVGKKFEEQFKKSIPDYCFSHRLRDSAMSYNNSGVTKFTWNNECDFFVFDCKGKRLYAIELKSTKYNYMSFENQKDMKSSRLIKFHQIKSLYNMSRYEGVIPCFIFNFRDEKNDTEKTYFQRIDDFVTMVRKIGKLSFTKQDLIDFNAIEIEGRKLRVNYIWDIDKFFAYIRLNGGF